MIRTRLQTAKLDISGYFELFSVYSSNNVSGYSPDIIQNKMAKARREFSNSMKDLQETFSNKLEQHIEDIDKKRERTAPSMALSLIPHLLGLFFCVVIIWVSKPGSS